VCVCVCVRACVCVCVCNLKEKAETTTDLSLPLLAISSQLPEILKRQLPTKPTLRIDDSAKRSKLLRMCALTMIFICSRSAAAASSCSSLIRDSNSADSVDGSWNGFTICVNLRYSINTLIHTDTDTPIHIDTRMHRHGDRDRDSDSESHNERDRDRHRHIYRCIWNL
jgi:hypothetical protein